MFQNLSAKVRAYIKRHFSFSFFLRQAASFRVLHFLSLCCCCCRSLCLRMVSIQAKLYVCIWRASFSIFSIAYVFISIFFFSGCFCSVSRDFLFGHFSSSSICDFYVRKKHGFSIGIQGARTLSHKQHTPIKNRKYTKIRFIVIVFI